MRRKAKSRKAALEWFKIKVTASAASVSYRGAGLSRIDPDGVADSVIKIEGTLDRPVLKRATAFLYVFCGATVGDNPGSAIGATTAWQKTLADRFISKHHPGRVHFLFSVSQPVGRKAFRS
jgi:hypothetical protein